MKKYEFYRRGDKHKEPIFSVGAPNRYQAALLFCKTKKLTLKQFLKIYEVSR